MSAITEIDACAYLVRLVEAIAQGDEREIMNTHGLAARYLFLRDNVRSHHLVHAVVP